MPDDFYYGWVDTYFNDHQEALVFGNKCLYKKYFPFLNHPETVARKINGFWFKGDEENIISFEDMVSYLSENTPCFIKRAVDCGGGEGVFYCDKDNLKENIKKILSIKEDIIIQKAIKQNGELNRIYDSSVNTIRIVSLLTENGVKIYGTVLRSGVNGSKVDNTSSGGVIVEIKENGELNDYAYSKSGKMEEHPNSHTKFKGFSVPSFDKIKEAVKKAHPCMPMFKLISWDFAVGENGEPIFVEANLSSGGCNIIQLASGPFFKEDTKEILDMIFKK